jgi:hypothetical protein
MVEFLSSKYKTLSSNPSTKKKNTNENTNTNKKEMLFRVPLLTTSFFMAKLARIRGIGVLQEDCKFEVCLSQNKIKNGLEI